ncbi:MAG: hypothetical protein WCI84_03310 [Bacteroidota bacterium]
MNPLSHRFFLFFLISIGVFTAVVVLARNLEYYILPMEERPFYERYNDLKPSGIESHGYGIIGTAMITIGVIMYSSRKRVRAFRQFGKIKHYLEVHIFLCLLGPVLVLYHTTFKFGGLVAVSFWSMSAVALSGLLGRYLYQHIPKNIEGNELSAKELEENGQKMLDSLHTTYALNEQAVKALRELGKPMAHIEEAGLLKLLWYLLINDLSQKRRIMMIRNTLNKYSVDKHSMKKVIAIVNDHIVFQQRIAVLEKVQEIFHYWHVVHLPFSIIMFVILLVHVGVAVTFGYTWIF